MKLHNIHRNFNENLGAQSNNAVRENLPRLALSSECRHCCWKPIEQINVAY